MTMTKKTALILSGGGARGAFQCAVEKYAREVKGYQWDIIAGVSVGALNGSMLAMNKGERLFEIWNTISNDQVYTGGFNFVSVVKLFFGSRSFYGNEPLQKMLAAELDISQIRLDLRVGTVSLLTGEYIQFTPGDIGFEQAVLASTVIPVIWEPVKISEQYHEMVDGGLRNITPIGDVLEDDPDEIVIINCSSGHPSLLQNRLRNIVQVGLRTIDLLTNEIFINDVNDFIRINALVKEAEDHGLVLHHPTSGRPLKYFDYKLVQPEINLGDTLDFSQATIQKSMAEGFKKARQVFGR
jgi:NTE family protein